MTAVFLVALVLFVIRQRRAENPLYDLHIAARPTFWVAAVAGVIVFGSLMGAMFIGQQFLQNVLGYSTLDAGLAILPAAIFMVLVAPRSAKLVEARGARFTLLLGYVFVLLGFVTMLAFWKEGIPYWIVGLGYAFVGIGVGFAGTPASHSLTGSVPVTKAGMASGTADLQRDLGGAIMQSIFGALLAAGYAASMAAAVAGSPNAAEGDTRADEPAGDVVCRRPVGRNAVPPVRHADHRGSQDGVPRGRSVRLHRRYRGRVARRGAGLLRVSRSGRTSSGCSRSTSKRTRPTPDVGACLGALTRT